MNDSLKCVNCGGYGFHCGYDCGACNGTGVMTQANLDRLAAELKAFKEHWGEPQSLADVTGHLQSHAEVLRRIIEKKDAELKAARALVEWVRASDCQVEMYCDVNPEDCDHCLGLALLDDYDKAVKGSKP